MNLHAGIHIDIGIDEIIQVNIDRNIHRQFMNTESKLT